MSWNEKKARERVSKNDFSTLKLAVKDLKREMDFTNLGTKEVLRAQGAHLYADVSNFHGAVKEAGNDKQKQRKLIRAASVLRRIQKELLKEYGIDEIQLQAVRLHGFCYKPYDSENDDGKNQDERARKSVILAITLNSYLKDVYNDVFSDVSDFEGNIGVADGQCYIANIGKKGARELISLGSCANLAAKIIDSNNIDTISVTRELYNCLPASLKNHFSRSRTVSGAVTYQAKDLRWGKYPELAKELDVTFDEKKLEKRTQQYKDDLPLSEIKISEADKLIKIDSLTERNNKRTESVSLYVDLDGFTKYVQAAEDDDDVISLVRELHMIRAEFHSVIQRDYDGLVLQHQGDRVFAILHLPSGDEQKKRTNDGLDVAIGLQSSMEHVLNELLSEKDIHVAIGLDDGKALVSRLGKKGQRQVICFGPEVSSAEHLQLKSARKQIRISTTVYDLIKKETKKKQFKKDGQNEYVAKDLTFPKLDQLEVEEAAKIDSIGAEINGSGISIVSVTRNEPRRPENTKPWNSEDMRL